MPEVIFEDIKNEQDKIFDDKFTLSDIVSTKNVETIEKPNIVVNIDKFASYNELLARLLMNMKITDGDVATVYVDKNKKLYKVAKIDFTVTNISKLIEYFDYVLIDKGKGPIRCENVIDIMKIWI